MANIGSAAVSGTKKEKNNKKKSWEAPDGKLSEKSLISVKYMTGSLSTERALDGDSFWSSYQPVEIIKLEVRIAL